jgi:hypothetical protein
MESAASTSADAAAAFIATAPENVYYNCSVFMELLDQQAKLRQKFSVAEKEIFNHMGGSFALGMHKLAACPATAESAQALMMCWNAIRTMKEEQEFLALTMDKFIAYMSITNAGVAAAAASPCHAGGLPLMPAGKKKPYKPRKPKQPKQPKQPPSQQPQQPEKVDELQQILDDLNKQPEKLEELQQILDDLHRVEETAAAPAASASGQEENIEDQDMTEKMPATGPLYYFEPEQLGSQQVDW